MDLRRGVTLLAKTLFLWDVIHQGGTSKGDVHLRLDSYLLVLIRPHEAGASAGRSLIDVIVGGCVPNGAGCVFSNDGARLFSLRGFAADNGKVSRPHLPSL